jgi:group I intron endonuclease
MFNLYVVENLITNQKYYGITSLSVKERWKKHQYSYRTEKKKNDCPKFYNSIRKYGVENFKISLIECSTDCQHIEKLEIEKISNDTDCLNVSPGGGGMTTNPGWKHSPETIQKLKEKTPPMLGKIHSEETKRKISESQKGLQVGEKNGMYGKTQSEEWKKERSIKMMQNNPMKGKTHTEEARNKISASKIGKPSSIVGMKMWNDGNNEKYSFECPGEGWKMGSLKTLSEEHIEKLRLINNNRQFSDETKQKMSEAKKGKPSNVKGMKWWNNGNSNKMSFECPGDGWKLGLLKNISQK